MSAERIYRILLRAYPPEFRAEYEREMLVLFRDLCREGDVRTVGFWAAVLYDIARSAPALRAEAWLTKEVFMKLAAVLTVVLALVGILGAGTEWVAGSKQAMPGAWMAAVVLGVFASALLLAAGIAILSGAPRGRQVARLALIASVVMVVAARLLFPWMGIFSQLVGFGLPVALLIALYWPHRASAAAA